MPEELSTSPDPIPRRQARLRREFTALYPGIDPGVWYPAILVAEEVFVRLAGYAASGDDTPRRILDARHFEFRGGTSGDGGAAWQPGKSPERRAL